MDEAFPDPNDVAELVDGCAGLHACSDPAVRREARLVSLVLPRGCVRSAGFVDAAFRERVLDLLREKVREAKGSSESNLSEC